MKRGAWGEGLNGVVFAALFLFAAAGAGIQAQTVAQIVKASSRASNGLVLRVLLDDDTTNALSAAKALGDRKDPYVGDILEGLFSHINGRNSSRDLLLLRVVLEAVFLRPSPAPAKIAVNARSLASLLSRLESIPDAATKGALLDISRYLSSGEVEKPLLAEGAFLIAYLRKTGGRFSPERRYEAVSFLEACRAHGNAVLRNQVITQVELARDPSFVRAARGYLAGGP